MKRKEFLSKIENKEIVFAIDERKAGVLVDSGLVGKSEYYALHFWSTISMLLHILAPISLFWLKWYWAVGIFILARMVWRATKKSNKDFVLEKAVVDDTFFDFCIKHNILVIKNK